MITTRRIYDPGKSDEQYKVFVDRLWPRGISKEKAGWDIWMKELSPSDELRKWFNHDPVKWENFKIKFEKELISKQAELDKLKQLEKKLGNLTLLYAAKDEVHNNAIALQELLNKKG